MTLNNNIEKKLEELGRAIGPDDTFTENVMARITAETAYTKKHKSITRIFLTSNLTKLTAAAVIILIVALGITLLDKSVTPAYAIEQTIEAFKGVRFMHAVRRDETGKVEDERWIEIGPDGTQARYRQDTPHSDFFVVDDTATVLVIHKKWNTAILYDPHDKGYTWVSNPGKWLKDLAGEGSMILEENVDYWGRKAHRVRWLKLNLDCFIDPETKLPIAMGRYEISYEEPPEGTFNLVVPDGMTVIDKKSRAEPTLEPQWMIDAERDEKIAQRNFDEARRALASGNYFKAVELFTRTIDIEPRRNWAWFWLARTHYELGEYDLAIWEFSKVIECFHESGWSATYCYFARGLAYANKGMEDAAKEDLRIALPIMIEALQHTESATLFDLADDPLRCADGLLDECHESPSREQSISMTVNRLRIITGQSFGYNPDAGFEENEQAITAWEDWFRNDGQIKFTPDAELVHVPEK